MNAPTLDVSPQGAFAAIDMEAIAADLEVIARPGSSMLATSRAARCAG